MKFINKDITTVEKGIIAHGCNAKGVMGSGVAKAIRGKWPKAYEVYKNRHLELGFVVQVQISSDLWVFNCITQETYGRDPNKVYADTGAVYSTMNTVAWGGYFLDLPIYIPRIGCGLGGLSWEDDVNPIILDREDYYDVEFTVCDYA